MAYVTAVTIGTSNKVSIDYQSQEVSVSVTFQLERSDGDLVSFVEDKAAEVERAHSTVWRRIRELRSEQKAADQAAQSNGQPVEEQPPPPKRRRRSMTEANGQPPEPSSNGAQPQAVDEGGVAVAEPPAPAPESPSEVPSSTAQQRAILSLANRAVMTDAQLTQLLDERFAKSRLEELTKQQAAQLLIELQRGEHR
jgi:hypothetical protein